MTTVLHAALALVPVCLFLITLVALDSYKLVSMRVVLVVIAAGAVAALGCDLAHQLVLQTGVSRAVLMRYIAPLTEESVKAALVLVLLAQRRVAFLADAVILGFAVGTGFALVENLQYVATLETTQIVLWIVRGLGTAVLHGATTAVVALIARTLLDRQAVAAVAAIAPGWALAVGVHSGFNHLPFNPLAMSLVLVLALPLLVLAVYARSERSTREWVNQGLDLDIELLGLIESEAVVFTRFGSYLKELAARFPAPIVADMFCLLRVELELSVQAKAMLLARQGGLELPPDPDVDAALEERDYLVNAIGTTALLTLAPLQITSDRDRWHRHLLGQRAAGLKTTRWWKGL
jgi:RsiW-degrading membrane proteinase PrsW (M82 family)